MNKRIVKLRKKLGLSQREFAEKAGISVGFMSYLENGQRSPSLATAIKLSAALGISLDALAGLKTYPYNEATLRIEITKLKQQISQIHGMSKLK